VKYPSISVALRVIVAMLVGVFVALVILEEDPQVKEKVGTYINTFMSTTYSCCFDAKVKRISLFTGEIELQAVTVSACNSAQWSWCADHITVSISLVRLITERICAISYALQGLQAHTVMQGTHMPLLDHIKDLVVIPSSIPTEFVGLTVHQGIATVQGIGGYTCTTPFDIDLLRIRNKSLLKITAAVHEGVVCKEDMVCIRQVAGTFSADIDADVGTLHDVLIRGNGVVSLLGITSRYHVAGTIADGLQLEYYSDDRTVQGTLQYNTELKTELTIALKGGAYALGYQAQDLEGQARGSLSYDIRTGTIAGDYLIDFKKDTYADTIMGTISSAPGADIHITGSCHDHVLKASLGRDTIWVKQIEYVVRDALVFSLQGTKDFVFTGSAQIEPLLPLVPFPGFCGTGMLSFVGTYVPEGISVIVDLNNAALRIPSTYNLIKSAHARCIFMMHEWCCEIQDLEVQFYKGSITAQKSKIYFDNTGAVVWGSAPILLHHCFVSWQKDIFMQFSGACLVHYAKGTGVSCKSYLMLERSYIRGNILAPEFQKKILSSTANSSQSMPAITIDILIHSREPVSVKTPFLDAAAHITLALQGTLPHIDGSGEIKLMQGKLKFPYKPLYVTEGTLYFLPGQLYDPHIELTAKNSIKKYSVGMSIRGTIKEPVLSFESSPMLEEPQIITLLLGGSEDGSLYFAMPEMIMLSLKNMLFGSAESSSKVAHYFKKLLRPLENIRIVPSFTDQSGRGGVRGSLVVEVNDRWRGFIEKNFNLSEDVKFGVEYDISDDASIRGVRDERGDIGGEIEMRWKL